MKLINLISRSDQILWQVSGPIEVDEAKGWQGFVHLVIHKTCIGSPLKLTSASRIPDVMSRGLSEP